MKSILGVILVLFLFSSCMGKANTFVLEESSIISTQQTTIFEDIVTTNTTSLFRENSVIDNNFQIDKSYSFSEIDLLSNNVQFSVNELSRIFGEPLYIYGYYNDKNADYEYCIISVMFEDAMFDLTCDNDEELNLIPISESEYYKLPNSSKDIQMKPKCMSIISGDWTLSYGIKLGDSKEKVYNAYNGNKGIERQAQGMLLISYNYGEYGSITYHFNDTCENSIISKLYQITIEWHNTYTLNNISPVEKAPIP
jgi:hypothetical protein